MFLDCCFIRVTSILISSFLFLNFFSRGVAQLVARYVRDVEAARSSRVTPTNVYLLEELTAKVEFGSQFLLFCYIKVTKIENLSIRVRIVAAELRDFYFFIISLR